MSRKNAHSKKNGPSNNSVAANDRETPRLDPATGGKFNPLKSRAVRKIPKSSKFSFVGELVYDNINGEPQRLGFSSYTEFKTAICLIYRDDFADIEEQLAGLSFKKPDGSTSTHHFDYRFTTKGGWKICISVKPERIADTFIYRATISGVKKAAMGNICDAVATVTDRNISPIEFHNAELFHAARRPQPAIDEKVIAGLKLLKGPVSINQFLEDIGLSGAGFFSVARAIRHGNARLFSLEKIRGKTLIERGDAA